MIDDKKNTTTGEPVTNRAPADAAAKTTEQPTADTSTPTDTKASTPTQTADKTAAAGTLPAGYLANGSMLDENGVIRPEYLEKYAQALAQSLKPLSASSFQRAFLSKAKDASKKKVPYSVKKNCAQGMIIQAMKLTHRRKDAAPAVLLDMVKLAAATVVDDATFGCLYLHLDAICTYMMME